MTSNLWVKLLAGNLSLLLSLITCTTALIVGLKSFPMHPLVAAGTVTYLMQHLLAAQLVKFLHKQQEELAAPGAIRGQEHTVAVPYSSMSIARRPDVMTRGGIAAMY
jgi:hypothetical protein